MRDVARQLPWLDSTLLQEFLTLRAPGGGRAELIDGEVVVSPAPDGACRRTADLVIRQIMGNARTRMDFSCDRGLVLPNGGLLPKNHLIPDEMFAPAELGLFANDTRYLRPEGVALIVEVTPDHTECDREVKRHCYARGGVPLYLLVDRYQRTVVLAGEPGTGDYTTGYCTPFGKPVTLPAPFSLTLDTTGFA
ncbi:Uma2 family endonuclease [Actinomadura craniellae]|uniref:Uma2 family endonuclease n=1 Tax=Actinomadura craniellae TaxID=2231787 RepID=A0A365H7A9_9ACTN|nr:Uma2 family endonuclease [Actinomadura craniellae]RAY14866.1 Uma2 family endonuclease [Actinomadura craniellae]